MTPRIVGFFALLTAWAVVLFLAASHARAEEALPCHTAVYDRGGDTQEVIDTCYGGVRPPIPAEGQLYHRNCGGDQDCVWMCLETGDSEENCDF